MHMMGPVLPSPNFQSDTLPGGCCEDQGAAIDGGGAKFRAGGRGGGRQGGSLKELGLGAMGLMGRGWSGKFLLHAFGFGWEWGWGAVRQAERDPVGSLGKVWP